ncbi:glycosyltransferase family 4 protein [Anaeromicrobium sediminis]|uniref:Undecaprenyl-phosphate alpha-N-acetylglucosaminyl 1-phosphate transferase n=1 Tax=Anaeromicrobium sediminis TaxID=1478221 RepID=A0A267MFI6_9FIRM|nr:MraY family glycosyltransferase [Anaeromicrobium sediminis]PAB58306.1 undecaprenyl-phosphate alpha-N-acetylglucosaminyl 1-phosphate transferase [Anaeromicrobium sediminis]
MYKYMISLLVAFIVSCIMTPFAIKLAHKIGAIDVPKDNRRVHKKPIPRMGGLAIFLGFVVSILVTLPIDKKIIGLIAGSTVIVIMGIMDDTKPLSPKQKFMGQLIAAVILVSVGISIEGFGNPITDKWIGFPLYLSIPVTIIWVVGITNTVNLIDGLDGLAAGVASIAALSLAYITYIQNPNNIVVMVLTLSVAGSAIGFLPYNFNPAKVFMGDTGSLFLGYILSAISILGVLKGATAIATIVPVLALGLPIFDTAFAIIRRFLNGKPIFEADKGHLHHRLLSRGLGQRRTVLTLYLISALLGASAVLISNNQFAYCFIIIFFLTTTLYRSIGKESIRGKNK